MAAQVANPLFGMLMAALPFILKRLGDHADRENALLACDTGDDRSRAGAGPTAHARRDEHHIRAFETFPDMVLALQCRIFPDFRTGAGAEPAGPFRAQLNLVRRQRAIERLQIGIGRDEIDPGEPRPDHRIHGIASGSADSDHLDPDRQQRIFLEREHCGTSSPVIAERHHAARES